MNYYGEMKKGKDIAKNLVKTVAKTGVPLKLEEIELKVSESCMCGTNGVMKYTKQLVRISYEGILDIKNIEEIETIIKIKEGGKRGSA